MIWQNLTHCQFATHKSYTIRVKNDIDLEAKN